MKTKGLKLCEFLDSKVTRLKPCWLLDDFYGLRHKKDAKALTLPGLEDNIIFFPYSSLTVAILF